MDTRQTATAPVGESGKINTQDQPISQAVAPANNQRSASPASSHLPNYVVGPMKRHKRDFDQVQNQSEYIRTAPDIGQLFNAFSPTTNPMLAFELADQYPISLLRVEYVGLYFSHINQATYCMLPKGPFLKWAHNGREKTADDKMLLYTIMAMGSRFSKQKESIEHCKSLLHIARDTERGSFGRFTLKLVQTRLILALLNFALGNPAEAWEYCGAAVQAVCGLKYNSEEAITDRPCEDDFEYGLDMKSLVECRRKTFWSAYLISVSPTFIFESPVFG